MRVLHLTTHLNIGGITTYIERLIQPLSGLGVQTYVVSSGGERSPDFEARGAKVFELPIKTKNELHPKLLLALPKLLRIIRDNQIDILHAHTRITQVLAALASKRTGLPVVTTCHGFYKLRLGRRLFPCWGDRAVAISGMVRDHLIKDFNLNEKQAVLIPNAVNIEELQAAYQKQNQADAKRKYGFSPEDPVVGITARLVADKGHEYLIRALPEIIKKIPQTRLLIVGDGKHRQSLEALVKELRLSSHVYFTGNVGDITAPLAAMDVFALPATWREGFGLSIVEAMACGIPIVVTNIWSLNTLIEDGKTGFMVPPKEIHPLSNAIFRLLSDPELTRQMTQEAQRLVFKQFGIQRMAVEMTALYSEVLRKR